MSDETLEKQITELELLYTKCVNNVNTSNAKVIEEERALLICMQRLMPLQNSYLTGLIKKLQSQIQHLHDKYDKPNDYSNLDATQNVSKKDNIYHTVGDTKNVKLIKIKEEDPEII
jgi:hypothetical protein